MATYSKSNGCFLLIKRLDRGEKRFVRQHLGTQNQSRSLFDALDKTVAYEESGFLKKHRKQAFHGHFAYNKHQLFRQILEALAVYRKEQSAESRLRQGLQELEVLFHKRLYGAARHILEKGLELAQQADLPGYAYLYGQWALRLRKNQALPDESASERLALVQRIQESLKSALETEEQQELTDRLVFAMRRLGPARDAESLAELRRLREGPELQDGRRFRNTEAHIQYHFARASYHFAEGNWTACEREMEGVLALMDADPKRLQWRMEEYLVRSNNFFMVWFRNHNYPRIEAQLDRLEALDLKNQGPEQAALKAHRFRICTAHRLRLYKQTARSREAVALAPTLEAGLQQHAPYLTATNRLGIYFDLAKHHHMLGDWDAALNWVARYQTDEQQCMRADRHGHLRLFKLVLHYEAGHRDLLPDMLVATYRYFRRQERLYPFERLMLTALKRWLRLPSVARAEAVQIQQLLEEMDDLMAKPQERHALEHFDFHLWLQAQVQGKSMAEAFAERQAKVMAASGA